MRRSSPGRTGARTGRRLVGALAAVVALLLAGCGGDPPEPQPLGDARAGSVATLADCSDWRQGTVEERMATIEQVRSEITPAGEEQSPALPDDRAYEFFERACAPPYASSFRLYKIYTRAATFDALEP